MHKSLQESMVSMQEMFLKRMADFEAELPRSQSAPTVSSLQSEFNSFKAFILDALNSFQRQVELLAHQVDTMEMRSRRKMLLLHGVTEVNQEDTSKAVLDVIHGHLKISDLQASDIRRCHRMGRPSGDHKPRPIVVKFVSASLRDKLWFIKTKLKGSGVTMSEFLTKERHEVFMSARKKFGVTQCWTREGYIHILPPDGSRHRVVSFKELNAIELKETEKPPTNAKQPAKSKRVVAQRK